MEERNTKKGEKGLKIEKEKRENVLLALIEMLPDFQSKGRRHLSPTHPLHLPKKAFVERHFARTKVGLPDP